MKPYLEGLMRDVRRAADALRHADATEFPLERHTKTPAEPRMQGNGRPTAPAPESTAPTPSRPRIIALVAERQVQPGALRYALGVCERLSAELQVLAGPALSPNVELQLSRACGERDIPWRVVPIGPHAVAEIPRYVKRVSGLLFVVTGAGDTVAERLVTGGRRRPFSRDVSLVVVAEGGTIAA